MSYIPEKIIYIMKPKESIETHFEDSKVSINKMDVYPTFAAQNEKTLETGRFWAEHRGNRDDDYTEETVPNKCNIRLRIIGLEYRREGGRAYKVIDQADRYFDLREDVLLETILSVGIKKGGFLNGTYLWGVVGSQNKLVRKGSELHKELLQATQLGKIKVIPIKDLEVGGVYKGKSNSEEIFLGHVINGETGKKNMLWMYMWKPIGETYQEYSDRATYCVFKKSHSMRQKIGQVNIPRDKIDKLRKRYREYLNEAIEKIKKCKWESNFWKNEKIKLKKAYYEPWIFMHRPDEKFIKNKDYYKDEINGI